MMSRIVIWYVSRSYRLVSMDCILINFLNKQYMNFVSTIHAGFQLSPEMI